LHSRLTSLKSLRLGRFAEHLTKLGLRQNLVSFLDPDIFSVLTNLEELDLYDNRVKTVGHALNNLSKLKCVVSLPLTPVFTDDGLCSILDLSFNLLKAVPDTSSYLTSLHTVYFVQNRISKISGLGSSSTLVYLELGGNKIRVRTFSPL
jgi:protein phosphatase 1 regulatory subunit 7